MRGFGKIALVALSSLILVGAAQAQSGTLSKVTKQKVAGKYCVHIKKKGEGKAAWHFVTKSGGKFTVKAKPSRPEQALCKLMPPNEMAKKGLAALPSVAKVVSARQDITSIRGGRVGVQTVSGTPPTIAEIVTNGASNTFWQTGIVGAINSGSPSNDQCNDFYNMSTDGGSGGFLACYMTEGTAYSVSEIARSGTSLCYMRGFPTTAVQAAGGVQLVSGTLPGGDITRVFNTPTGSSPRTVKIGVGAGEEGQTIFIKVYSANQNARAGNQYAFDIWFCENGANAAPQEYETTRISVGGEYIATGYHTFGSGNYSSVTRAFLTRSNGALEINPRLQRSATFAGVATGSSFKSEIVLNGSNEIFSKVYDIHSGFPARKAYSVARFAGSGLTTLQFFEGAYKDNAGFGQNGFSGAVEFRDSYYAAASSSSYLTDLAAVDLNTNSFYQSEPIVTGDTSDYSCAATPDIELALDMENSAMVAVAANCEGDRIDGDTVRFCRSEALQQAQDNYQSYCTGP